MLYSDPATTAKHATVTDFDYAARRTFKKDMSLTPAEFTRALPKAVQGVVTQSEEAGHSFRVDNGEHVAVFHCTPLANRKIGSLSLPRLDVEIDLRGFGDTEASQFIDRFDVAFLRMGG